MAGGGDFAERERLGARNFARMAKGEGVERVVYLGGLGEESQSAHLRSRHETAACSQPHGPPLTYFRAAMVVGAGSESYRTLRYLVGTAAGDGGPELAAYRRPSRSGSTPSSSTCAAAPDVPESEGREVQIGGPDVLTYSRCSTGWRSRWGSGRDQAGGAALSPWLSSLWLGLVTPVDTKVARPAGRGPADADRGHRPERGGPFEISPEASTRACGWRSRRKRGRPSGHAGQRRPVLALQSSSSMSTPCGPKSCTAVLSTTSGKRRVVGEHESGASVREAPPGSGDRDGNPLTPRSDGEVKSVRRGPAALPATTPVTPLGSGTCL